jgi:hypothetical protein
MNAGNGEVGRLVAVMGALLLTPLRNIWPIVMHMNFGLGRFRMAWNSITFAEIGFVFAPTILSL